MAVEPQPRRNDEVDDPRARFHVVRRQVPALIRLDERRHVVPQLGLSVADRYEVKWRGKENGLFDAQAEPGQRPLRDAVIQQLALKNGPLLVVEAGSGAAGDAIEIVRTLTNQQIEYIAVDPSSTATVLAQRNVDQSRHDFRNGSRIALVTDTIEPVLGQVGSKQADVVYSVSVGHVMDDQGFDGFVDRSVDTLKEDGFFVIGLKTIEDSLLGRPTTHVTGFGPRGISAMIAHDGLERRFLTGSENLDELMDKKGLERVGDPVFWSARGYDFPSPDPLERLKAHLVGGVFRRRR